MDMDEALWGKTNTASVEKKPAAELEEEDIKIDCKRELDRYLNAPGQALKIKTDKGEEFSDPLDMWKVHAASYPVLAKLARAFLSIPATLAPSERVWSQSANVVSAKRAHLGEKLTGDIIFVKENKHILRKHYKLLAKDDKNALPLDLIGIPPEISGDDVIDVGQDLFEG